MVTRGLAYDTLSMGCRDCPEHCTACNDIDGCDFCEDGYERVDVGDEVTYDYVCQAIDDGSTGCEDGYANSTNGGV